MNDTSPTELRAQLRAMDADHIAVLKERDEALALYRGLLQGYEQANRERVAALAERDALKGIVASLHERAVRATEALGVIYGVARRAK